MTHCLVRVQFVAALSMSWKSFSYPSLVAGYLDGGKKNDGYSKPKHLPLPLFFTASIRLTITLQYPASDRSNSILEVHFCASERLWARVFKASVSIVWFAWTMTIVVKYQCHWYHVVWRLFVSVEKKMVQESQSQGGEEKPQEAVKPFGNVLGDEHSHKMFAFKYLHVYRRR